MTFDYYGSASTTDASSPRRLVPPDALRRLEPGTALLLYAHLPPVRVTLRNGRNGQDTRPPETK